MFVRGYLRASTDEQDANRAREQLVEFAKGKGHSIASFYVENESGRKLHRPELTRLINDASESDVILLESIDRLTRLTSDDWVELKTIINSKKLRIVAQDLPSSHVALKDDIEDETTQSIMKAVNGMLIDVMAAMAAKDYVLRRERAAQGIAARKAKGLSTGRTENVKRNTSIMKMLTSGMTYSEIQVATGASRVTISKLKKRLAEPS